MSECMTEWTNEIYDQLSRVRDARSFAVGYAGLASGVSYWHSPIWVLDCKWSRFFTMFHVFICDISLQLCSLVKYFMSSFIKTNHLAYLQSTRNDNWDQSYMRRVDTKRNKSIPFHFFSFHVMTWLWKVLSGTLLHYQAW